MTFEDGHRFSTKIKLSKKEVSDFARSVGDLNPIHHDENFAKTSKFGGLIASGPHTSSLLMSYTATYFSKYSPMVGLEFRFKFKSAVRVDDEVNLEWMVVNSRPSEKFGGHIIDLRGRLISSSGETAVGAKGKVLLSERLG